MKTSKISTHPSENHRVVKKKPIPTLEISIQDEPEGNLMTERSPLIVPMQFERFAGSFFSKYSDGKFLGRSSPENQTNQRRQYSQIRCVAKSEFLKGIKALEPTPEALERTKRAAKDFFRLSYQLLERHSTLFPLAGRNKCLGMVAVPTKRLVILAISQDKNPENDESLRKEMIVFLNALNLTSDYWTFELACIPTKAQYLMPRTLSMRAPQAAPDASVNPHTRCVEVALMAALCKAGRTINFTSTDTGIIAFGGTLWLGPTGKEAIPHFEGADRNTKHRKHPPLEVEISNAIRGWIDIWEPCPDHCQIYKYEMLAIGAAGGFSGSFYEPRSEGEVIKKKNTAPKKIETNQKLFLGIAYGLISAAMGISGSYVYNRHEHLPKANASAVVFLIGAVMASLGVIFITDRYVFPNKKTAVPAPESEPERTERTRSYSF
jgi:hypothetical protein